MRQVTKKKIERQSNIILRGPIHGTESMIENVMGKTLTPLGFSTIQKVGSRFGFPAISILNNDSPLGETLGRTKRDIKRSERIWTMADDRPTTILVHLCGNYLEVIAATEVAKVDYKPISGYPPPHLHPEDKPGLDRVDALVEANVNLALSIENIHGMHYNKMLLAALNVAKIMEDINCSGCTIDLLSLRSAGFDETGPTKSQTGTMILSDFLKKAVDIAGALIQMVHATRTENHANTEIGMQYISSKDGFAWK